MNKAAYMKKWREINQDYLSEYEKERSQTFKRKEQMKKSKVKRRLMIGLVRKSGEVPEEGFIDFCVVNGLLWTSENIYGEIVYHSTDLGRQFKEFLDRY